MQPTRPVRLQDHPILLAAFAGCVWYQRHVDTNAMRRRKTVGLVGVMTPEREQLEVPAAWCLKPQSELQLI